MKKLLLGTCLILFALCGTTNLFAGGGFEQIDANNLPNTCSLKEDNITIAIADINKDGNDDLIIGKFQTTPGTSYINIWIWDSVQNKFVDQTAKWMPATAPTPTGLPPAEPSYKKDPVIAITTGDLHGDGNTDIIVNTAYNGVFVYINQNNIPDTEVFIEQPIANNSYYWMGMSLEVVEKTIIVGRFDFFDTVWVYQDMNSPCWSVMNYNTEPMPDEYRTHPIDWWPTTMAPQNIKARGNYFGVAANDVSWMYGAKNQVYDLSSRVDIGGITYVCAWTGASVPAGDTWSLAFSSNNTVYWACANNTIFPGGFAMQACYDLFTQTLDNTEYIFTANYINDKTNGARTKTANAAYKLPGFETSDIIQEDLTKMPVVSSDCIRATNQLIVWSNHIVEPEDTGLIDDPNNTNPNSAIVVYKSKGIKAEFQDTADVKIDKIPVYTPHPYISVEPNANLVDVNNPANPVNPVNPTSDIQSISGQIFDVLLMDGDSNTLGNPNVSVACENCAVISNINFQPGSDGLFSFNFKLFLENTSGSFTVTATNSLGLTTSKRYIFDVKLSAKGQEELNKGKTKKDVLKLYIEQVNYRTENGVPLGMSEDNIIPSYLDILHDFYFKVRLLAPSDPALVNLAIINDQETEFPVELQVFQTDNGQKINSKDLICLPGNVNANVLASLKIPFVTANSKLKLVNKQNGQQNDICEATTFSVNTLSVSVGGQEVNQTTAGSELAVSVAATYGMGSLTAYVSGVPGIKSITLSETSSSSGIYTANINTVNVPVGKTVRVHIGDLSRSVWIIPDGMFVFAKPVELRPILDGKVENLTETMFNRQLPKLIEYEATMSFTLYQNGNPVPYHKMSFDFDNNPMAIVVEVGHDLKLGTDDMLSVINDSGETDNTGTIQARMRVQLTDSPDAAQLINLNIYPEILQGGGAALRVMSSHLDDISGQDVLGNALIDGGSVLKMIGDKMIAGLKCVGTKIAQYFFQAQMESISKLMRSMGVDLNAIYRGVVDGADAIGVYAMMLQAGMLIGSPVGFVKGAIWDLKGYYEFFASLTDAETWKTLACLLVNVAKNVAETILPLPTVISIKFVVKYFIGDSHQDEAVSLAFRLATTFKQAIDEMISGKWVCSMLGMLRDLDFRTFYSEDQKSVLNWVYSNLAYFTNDVIQENTDMLKQTFYFGITAGYCTAFIGGIIVLEVTLGLVTEGVTLLLKACSWALKATQAIRLIKIVGKALTEAFSFFNKGRAFAANSMKALSAVLKFIFIAEGRHWEKFAIFLEKDCALFFKLVGKYGDNLNDLIKGFEAVQDFDKVVYQVAHLSEKGVLLGEKSLPALEKLRAAGEGVAIPIEKFTGVADNGVAAANTGFKEVGKMLETLGGLSDNAISGVANGAKSFNQIQDGVNVVEKICLEAKYAYSLAQKNIILSDVNIIKSNNNPAKNLLNVLSDISKQPDLGPAFELHDAALMVNKGETIVEFDRAYKFMSGTKSIKGDVDVISQVDQNAYKFVEVKSGGLNNISDIQSQIDKLLLYRAEFEKTNQGVTCAVEFHSMGSIPDEIKLYLKGKNISYSENVGGL